MCNLGGPAVPKFKTTPIAYVRFTDPHRSRLQVVCCPYCDKVHYHGSGGRAGPDFGHRLAHCGGSLGYDLKLEGKAGAGATPFVWRDLATLPLRTEEERKKYDMTHPDYDRS
jgi:hypothetical protein